MARRLLILSLSLLILGCIHFEEKTMSMSNIENNFTSELNKSDIKNIDVGFIENNLFGDSDKVTDENGVKNRKIKIFYFIKKANIENAPYLVFLNGGPGIAITDMFFQYQYNTFYSNVNVIFFDQRGNGLSDEPSADINELSYYSAKYIVSDAEKIREKLLGKNSKWNIFGQSYGGIIARKYIEYKAHSIKRVITHGSAKYDPIDVAVNTEINTFDRLKVFTTKYPDDVKLIEKTKFDLSDHDSICSKIFCIKGKGLIHILAILYSVKSDDDFHSFLNQIDKDNPKQSFLEKIKPLSTVLLEAGLVNQAVAQIDMIGDISSDDVSIKSKEILKSRGIDIKNAIFSKQLFDESLITISDDLKQLENNFKTHKFKTDVVDLNLVVRKCNNYGIHLDVFGGVTDTLAINSIKNEESYIRTNFKTSSFINYHYSNGHHREWLTNNEIFKKIILE